MSQLSFAQGLFDTIDSFELSIKLQRLVGQLLVRHAMKELVRHGSKGNNKREKVKRKGVTLKQIDRSK